MKRVVIFLVLLSALSFSSVISNVEFKGLENLSQKFAKSLVKDYIGSDASLESVSMMKKALLESGYFESIDAKLNIDENGNIIVVFYVKENPILKKWDIDIDGPELVSKNDLASAVVLKDGTILNLNDLKVSIQNIADVYRDNGYVLIEAYPEIGQGTLTIHIKEYALWDVKFEGIDGIDENSLKKEMGLKLYKDYQKAPFYMKWFLSEKDYYPKLSNIQMALKTLQDKVYFESVSLKVEKIKKDVKANLVDLVFDLKLRKLFDRKKNLSLKIEGASLIKESEIRKALDWSKKLELDSMGVLMKAQKLLDLYKDKGYMLTWVDVIVKNDAAIFKVYEKRIGSIEYEFEKNGQSCIVKSEKDSCSFSHTRLILVKDLVSFKKGDPLKKSSLVSSYAALSRSRYFDKVDIVPLGDRESTNVTIRVSLKEKEKKFQFMGGAGWGPPGDNKAWWEGIMGQLQLSTINPLGLGQNISLSLNLGLDKKVVQIGYSIPRPFDAPLTVGSGFGYTYTSDATSATSNVYVKGSIQTLALFDNIFGVSSKYSYDFQSNDQSLEVSLSHDYDTRNAPFLPTSGFRSKEIFTISGILKSDQSYTLMQSGEIHIPIYWKFHAALKEFYGRVLRGDGKITPAPRDSVRGQSLSGSEVMRGAAEIRYRVYDQEMPVDLVLFYDAGKAESFVWSSGLGIGIAAPIFGEIEFGYAYKYPQDSFDLYFVFGMDLPWTSF